MHCVIFTGGGLPDPEHSRPFVDGADFCVAADSGLIAAEACGLVPDVITGDFDSLAEKDGAAGGRLEKYPPEKIRCWQPDKDYSDTELALLEARSYARQKGCAEPKITLVGGEGGRVDHFLAIYGLYGRDLYPHVWLCGFQVLYLLNAQSGIQNQLRLENLTPADPVSVFPVGGAAKKLHTAGLHWELDDFAWTPGSCSLSNRICIAAAEKQQPVVLHAVSGSFAVIAPLAGPARI